MGPGCPTRGFALTARTLALNSEWPNHWTRLATAPPRPVLLVIARRRAVETDGAVPTPRGRPNPSFGRAGMRWKAWAKLEDLP